MSKPLLEQLPLIVKEGRKQAGRILESLETRSRVRLQIRLLPKTQIAWGEMNKSDGEDLLQI